MKTKIKRHKRQQGLQKESLKSLERDGQVRQAEKLENNPYTDDVNDHMRLIAIQNAQQPIAGEKHITLEQTPEEKQYYNKWVAEEEAAWLNAARGTNNTKVE